MNFCIDTHKYMGPNVKIIKISDIQAMKLSDKD